MNGGTVTVAQLVALLRTTEALAAQIRAMLPTQAPPDETPKCPRCGSTDLAEAGQDLVCPCGANIRDGVVIGG